MANIENSQAPTNLAELVKSINVQVSGSSRFRRFQRMYYNDRIAFVYDCIPALAKTLADYQAEILGYFDEGYSRVAVRGPHGLGKTTLAACLVHHSVLTAEEDCKVPTTASAWRQLEKYLWPEIKKIAKMMDWNKVGRSPYDPRTELLSLSIRMNQGTVEAFAIASDDHNTIEGAHGTRLVYVFDEAKTIPRPTWNAAEGAFSNADIGIVKESVDFFQDIMDEEYAVPESSGEEIVYNVAQDSVQVVGGTLSGIARDIESGRYVVQQQQGNVAYESIPGSVVPQHVGEHSVYADMEDVAADVLGSIHVDDIQSHSSIQTHSNDAFKGPPTILPRLTRMPGMSDISDLPEQTSSPEHSSPHSESPQQSPHSRSSGQSRGCPPAKSSDHRIPAPGRIAIPHKHSHNPTAKYKPSASVILPTSTEAINTFQALAFAISTPGDPSGQFYDIHMRKPGFEHWKTRHVTVDEAIAAGRISAQWVAQMARQWGEESSMFQNRVLGEFADVSDEGIIPLSWVRAAVNRWYAWDKAGRKDPGEPKTAGVDVARMGGDATVICLRNALVLTNMLKFSKLSTTSTAGYVRRYGTGRAVNIEADGGLGASVYDIIKEDDWKASLSGRAHIPMNITTTTVSAGTTWKDRTGKLSFENVRAAMWWNMRDLLDPNYGSEVALPPVDELILDLSTPRVLDPGRDGRILLESKASIRARIGRSTDYGDACCLAFWKSSRGGGVVI